MASTDSGWQIRARDRVLPIGSRTYVMAIVNLTHDSFSGDGVGTDIEEAVRRAVRAQEDGADIVDLGAESARADVPVQDLEREATLVAGVVHRVVAETDLLVSADTYKGSVAEAALQAGAHIINDIGGFMYDTSTARVAARYGAALVVNYTFERPKIRPTEPPRYRDLIGDHISFLRDRVSMAVKEGVSLESIVVDPGIAFGKSHDEDLQVLRRLREFRSMERPILVAASRKHFLGSVLGLSPAERDVATAAVTALSVALGADIVRVHDVRKNVESVRIADAIVRGRPGDFAPSPETWPWAQSAQPVPGTTISGQERPPGR